MLKNLILSMVAVAFVASCASKKKSSDAEGMDAAGVEDRSMQFDPLGSDSGTIEGLRTVFFEYDQAALTPEAQNILKGNAEWLRNHPNVSLQIEGHCDERGSVEYNLSLGERRGRTVKNFLEAQGISAQRLSIISYGEEKPLVRGTGESVWAQNRRANFVPIAQ
jgi:peptidoglycan-associated lipoprotein